MSENRLRILRRYLTLMEGRKGAIQETVARDTLKAEEAEKSSREIEQAVVIVQAATETRRQELRDRVESLVTRGLRAVFGREDFEFALKVTLRRDTIGVVPVLRSKFGDQDLETDFQDGRAGGIKDVTAFLLRAIVLSLARPRLAPVLILDEAFSHVSNDLLRGVAGLIKELNESAGIQFLMVTHKPELLDAADVIYSAKLEEGRTTFTLEHDMRDEVYHRRPRRGEEGDRRLSKFDHEDMTTPERGEPTISETSDAQARRHRRLELEKKPRTKIRKKTRRKTRKKR